jgi:two-component system chemotaxis response regulator CheB
MARIKEQGGLAIVQDPATAESSQMPEAAIAATRIDQVLPLSEIARFLGKLTSKTEVGL